MYFTLELNGERRLVRARASASIGQVTQLAFGPTAHDAKVAAATRYKRVALAALDARQWPFPFQRSFGPKELE